MAGLALCRTAQLAALVALGLPCLRGCDDARAPAHKREQPMLAFSSCTMCHVDAEEQLAKGGHGPAGLTCASCHGESKGHVTDEHNDVKPERMFAAETASSLCGECHAAQAGQQATPSCIECHGSHEILTGKAATQATRRLGVKKPH